MRGRVHAAIGFAVSTGISLSALCLHEFYNPSSLQLAGMAIFVPTTVFGSLLPDIDHLNATLSKNSPRIFRFLYRYIVSAGDYFGNQTRSQILASHRGICHSISACISVLTLLLPFVFFNPILFFESGMHGIILGMILHILCDAFTPAGVMLFAPFSTKQYHIKLSRSRIKQINRKGTPFNFKYHLITGFLYICNLIFTWLKLMLFYILIIISLIIILTLFDLIMRSHSFSNFSITTFTILTVILLVAIATLTLIINKFRQKLSLYLFRNYGQTSDS
ncbi:MAG: metal-dependent hydrolase [Lachnospiraceae bacterium]